MQLSTRALVGGVGLYAASALGVYAYLRSKRGDGACGGSCGCPAHGDAPGGLAAFDRIAPEYDQRINTDETVMGIKLLRWWLMREAQARAAAAAASAAGGRVGYASD